MKRVWEIVQDSHGRGQERSGRQVTEGSNLNLKGRGGVTEEGSGQSKSVVPLDLLLVWAVKWRLSETGRIRRQHIL